jgi:hypothetical protein
MRVGIAASEVWQSVSSVGVSPRVAHWADASTYCPLTRTTPPSHPRNAMSGLFPAKAIACWSGCIPSGGDWVSLVMSVKLTPALVER